MCTMVKENENGETKLLSFMSRTEIKNGPKSEHEVKAAKQKLRRWINKHMKIEMTDGRVLVGMFLCTDRDGNVILGSCSEYLSHEVFDSTDEPRLLGLVMVPGRHIVSIHSIQVT